MGNLSGSYLDARNSHHSCEYCGYADKYRCDNIQYLRNCEEMNFKHQKRPLTHSTM